MKSGERVSPAGRLGGAHRQHRRRLTMREFTASSVSLDLLEGLLARDMGRPARGDAACVSNGSVFARGPWYVCMAWLV